MPQIAFHSLHPSFRLKNSTRLKRWIERVVNSYNHFPGEINYIFCSDNYLLNLHIKFLKQSTYTDIITFNYNSGSLINGDIFISIDRVSENAETYVNKFEDELHRVMIHGILHLLGFGDKSLSHKKKMRLLEDSALIYLEKV